MRHRYWRRWPACTKRVLGDIAIDRKDNRTIRISLAVQMPSLIVVSSIASVDCCVAHKLNVAVIVGYCTRQ